MILFFIKKFKKIIFISSLISIFTAGASLSLFHMVGASGESGFQPFEILVYTGLWLFLLCGSMITSRILSFYSSGTVNSVRTSLVKRILDTDYGKLEQAGRAKLHNILTNDVNAIAGALAEMPAFIYNFFLLIACFSYLFYLSPIMFGILISTVCIAFIFTKLVMNKITREARSMREHQDEMFEGYRGLLDGAKQLTINNDRKYYYYNNSLAPVLKKLQESERRYGFAWDMNRNISQALIFLILGAIVVANQFVQNGQLIMSYILIVTYISGPFGYVMNLWQNIARAKVSMEKIESLNIVEHKADFSPADLQDKNDDWQQLSFVNVGFKYQNNKGDTPFALKPIDLSIQRGEVIFIVGGNGSGKSTFLHLLLGLYQPKSGHMMLNENPLTLQNMNDYRSRIAMVLPDFYLYNSVLDNQGKQVSKDRVEALLDKFQLRDKVQLTENGFSSVSYSQGQRKRLALISAIAEDKDIYVLDEWAADQDPYFRDVFYTEILPWLKAKGKTIIAVTHDDRYFDMADRRLKFDLGEMIELPVSTKQAA